MGLTDNINVPQRLIRSPRIEEVYNDPAAGYVGLYGKIGAAGFGLNDHWTELP